LLILWITLKHKHTLSLKAVNNPNNQPVDKRTAAAAAVLSAFVSQASSA